MRGDIVTPAGVQSDQVLIVKADTIDAIVAPDKVPQGVQVIDVGGFVLPGLVDLHNHVTWNIHPRWSAPTVVRDRYEWLDNADYKQRVDKPQYALRNTNACDEQLYGEVKAIIGGATSVTGNLSDPTKNACEVGLVRNLDVASQIGGNTPNQEPIRYEPFPFELDPKKEDLLREGLTNGTTTAAILHLAEGTSAAAKREFKILEKHDLLRKGTVLVHGVALGRDEFEKMAQSKVGLVWSPRSNIELYGATTDIKTARERGVRVAISPDWAVTGSQGMLDELAYARGWVDKQSIPLSSEDLFGIATTIPAELSGHGSRLGQLTPGYLADILVVDKPPSGTAYDAAVATSPRRVRLVLIGGHPAFGRPELVGALSDSSALEDVNVCGETRKLNLSTWNNGSGASLSATSARLLTELANYNSSLSPLADCP